MTRCDTGGGHPLGDGDGDRAVADQALPELDRGLCAQPLDRMELGLFVFAIAVLSHFLLLLGIQSPHIICQSRLVFATRRTSPRGV